MNVDISEISGAINIILKILRSLNKLEKHAVSLRYV